MFTSLYRATCLGEPRGPWRLQKEQARRDAVQMGLGQFDERGRYWDTVPGRIETVQLPNRLVLQAADQLADRAA